jgi:hypothetical protein
MDIIDNLPLEQLEEYRNPAYEAGLAHGIIMGSMIILFLWMCCVQCRRGRPLLMRDRLREASMYL